MRRSIFLAIMIALVTGVNIIMPSTAAAATDIHLQLPAGAAILQWGLPDNTRQAIAKPWGERKNLRKGQKVRLSVPSRAGKDMIIIGKDYNGIQTFSVYMDDLDMFFTDIKTNVPMDPAKKNEWLFDNGRWYYLGADGMAKYDEWANINGRWYYFDSSSRMYVGWLRQTSAIGNPIWYYLQPNGSMATGWKRMETSSGWQWYYFNGSGAMRTGWVKYGNGWYYMKSDGVMATGWIKIDGNWYYARPANGNPAAGSEGAILQGGQWEIGGKPCRFDSSGRYIL